MLLWIAVVVVFAREMRMRCLFVFQEERRLETNKLAVGVGGEDFQPAQMVCGQVVVASTHLVRGSSRRRCWPFLWREA